jgi:hypothetical protein
LGERKLTGTRNRHGCVKLVAAGILPAVSGGFQPLGRGPGAFSSGETPDLSRQKASLMQPWPIHGPCIFCSNPDGQWGVIRTYEQFFF